MDIIYDGRKDPMSNDLVLTLQNCFYHSVNGIQYFNKIIRVIDYGQIMSIVCKKYTVLFDKISWKSMDCSEIYLYSIMYEDSIYEWYFDRDGLCRYVSHKDKIDIVDYYEDCIRASLSDPISMFFANYRNTKDIDLRNINYGIDLVAIYKSRGIRVSNNYVDLLIVTIADSVGSE